MRIGILGGAGQLALVISPALRKRFPQAEIIGTTRNSKAARKAPGMDRLLEFDPYYFDWQSLGRFDVLINAIGQFRRSDDDCFERAHMGISSLIIASRSLLGTPRLIQISALGADPEHPTPFLRTKGQADAILARESDVQILRPSIVCTPKTELVQRLRLLGRVERWLGGQLPLPREMMRSCIQPLLADDLAKAVVQSCLPNAAPRIAELAGPERISLRRLLALALKNVAQSKGRLPREVSLRAIQPFLRYGLAERFPSLITYNQIQLLLRDNTSSRDDTLTLLGYRPRSTLAYWQQALQS